MADFTAVVQLLRFLDIIGNLLEIPRDRLLCLMTPPQAVPVQYVLFGEQAAHTQQMQQTYKQGEII
jgi:hypothetical protein